VAQAALDVSQLVQRIRHLAVLRVQLADLGKCLAGTLQVTFGRFTSPNQYWALPAYWLFGYLRRNALKAWLALSKSLA
jgi:hypothetical protein